MQTGHTYIWQKPWILWPTVFSIVLIACISCSNKNLTVSSHSLADIKAIKYSWSGGAAGLSGVTYEIEVTHQGMIMQDLWFRNKKLKLTKVDNGKSTIRWRANYSSLGSNPLGNENTLIAFPIEFDGEAVFSYRINNQVHYQGIASFQNVEAKEYE